MGTDLDVEIVRASAYGMWSWGGCGPSDFSDNFSLLPGGSVTVDGSPTGDGVGVGYEWRVNPDTQLIEILHAGADEPSIYMKYNNRNDREGNLVVIEPFEDMLHVAERFHLD